MLVVDYHYLSAVPFLYPFRTVNVFSDKLNTWRRLYPSAPLHKASARPRVATVSVTDLY